MIQPADSDANLMVELGLHPLDFVRQGFPAGRELVGKLPGKSGGEIFHLAHKFGCGRPTLWHGQKRAELGPDRIGAC